jgi:hypothetical protein
VASMERTNVGTRDPEAPRERARDDVVAPATPVTAANVLRLQRSAGNRAVSGMVDRSRERRSALQRYEAGEHAQVGGPETVMVNGVEMSQGEVNAMGDFFGSPNAMQSASPEELTALRDLVRRDRDARTGKPGAVPVSTEEWEIATHGRYLKLAAENRAHFAPPAGSPGLVGENHKARWYELHRQALFQAWFDGRFNGHKVSNGARTVNAFGAHFLTDAFSAGHLINKPMVTQFAREHWDKAATTGLLFKENKFTQGVAAAVVNNSVAGPKLKARQLKILDWGEITVTRFSEFLWQFAKQDPDKFFNGFARIVHDHLDDAMKGPNTGVEVTNERGDGPWRLSGDATLALSADTLRIANEAAHLAETNLATAANATSEPDYTALSAQVWALTPRPTQAGAKMVADAVTHIADAADPDSVAAFSALAISEIDAGIKELTDAGYMRVTPARVPESYEDFALHD